MIQTILIGIFFTGALAYLIWTIRKQFVSKNSCAKGCGCSAVDIAKIEKQITSGAISQKDAKAQSH